MDPRKRAWIWAGLGLAAGVGVVIVTSKSGDERSKLPEPEGGGSLPPATPPRPQPTMPERPPRVTVVPGARVLLLGDSIAQGLTAPLNRLVTDAKASLSVTAKMGTTISAWSGTPPPKSDIALVSLGTNDMKLLDPLAEKSKLEALLLRLRETSRRVVWVSPPPMPFQDRGVRQMLASTTAAAGVELFPSIEVPRGPDGVHPNASGYAALAGLLWRWIG